MAKEKPSSRVRAIAGRVLRIRRSDPEFTFHFSYEGNGLTWDDIEYLAGFVVNVSPDRPKPVKRHIEPVKRGKRAGKS